MHIIGSVIKQALELRNQFKSENGNTESLQRHQLTTLLETARDTAFGKFYDFRQILASHDIKKEFARKVPVYDYNTMYDRWWKQSYHTPDISWPGKPYYYALSSGTTGREPKRIPVTENMITSIRKVGISQLTSIANFDLPSDFFEKQILMLGSSTNLIKVGDHEEGEISGIGASNIPGWMEAVYRPGFEIAGIDDWDERVRRIAREAPGWDIGAISGIPSWVLLMLKEVVRENKLKNIHEIWPGLRVYVSGGVALGPFKASLEKIFGSSVIYMDTYLASEGFFAYNSRPGTDAMKLALEHGIYFEFIPFDERGFDKDGNLADRPLVLSIDEVEPGTDYALVISTCAGTWRYMIGDTIKFTDIGESEIEITGRTKYFLNVVGSQLSEEKMNAAIREIEKKFDLPVEEFTLAAVRDEQDDYYHEWILGTQNPGVSNEDLAGCIDDLLKEINKAYGVARSKALKGVKVLTVPAATFHKWHEQTRKKGGQVKTQKLMTEKDFKRFRDFAISESSVEKV